MPMGIDVSTCEGEKYVGQVAIRLGLGIDQPCGGTGICGKCRVMVSGGTSAPTEQELRALPPEDIASGYRLACRCPVEDGLVVTLEGSSAPDPERLQKGMEAVRYGKAGDPLVRSRKVDLEMPDVRGRVSSLSEIAASGIGLAGGAIPLSLMGSLSGAFSGKGPATAVFSDTRLVALEQGQTFKPYGLAIDVGTTSLVMWLSDLSEGTAVDAMSDLNPQVSFGADVLTRLSHIAGKEGGLEELRSTLLSELNRMTVNIARRNGISPGQICAVSVAGNTCMEHILLGVDPSPIGKSPFIPPCREFPPLDAATAGLRVNPLAEVVMVPNISGYVGGDITAGIEASGMAEGPEMTLFVDIGTNSEIVLGNRDFLVSCSAAAGPAFEGARIGCGMRAARGAIERVSVENGLFSVGVIGGTEPVGICGSGIVDLVAEMLRWGLVDQGGKMPEHSDEGIRRLIAAAEGGMKHIELTQVGHGRGGKKLLFTQKDVREVQLAKGAIATGIQALLEKKGLGLDDLDRVVVGGAFGNYLNPGNAVAIGVLPRVPLEIIEYMGNTSIVGAFHALVSRKDFEYMRKIARTAEYVELSTICDFQKKFLANLSLGPASPDKG